MAENWSPRFNHVAMSVAREQVEDATWRGEVTAFFSEVFGWQEVSRQAGREATTLIFMAYSPYQFVFLLAADTSLVCPPMDHFGMQVASRDELETLHRKAAAFGARDARVRLIPPKTEVEGPFRLASFYVGYLIPLMIEVQHFEPVSEAGGR